MQSISTKILQWTNTKPRRVKATAAGGESVTITASGGRDFDHVLAAQSLKDRLKWRGRMYGGFTKEGMVFVFRDNKSMLK